MWLTEVGWAGKCDCSSPFVANGERGQATRLKCAFRLVRDKRRTYRIGRINWFMLYDVPWRGTGSTHDWWVPNTGLFTKGRRPKRAWGTFTSFTGGRAGTASIPHSTSSTPPTGGGGGGPGGGTGGGDCTLLVCP